MQFQGNLTTLYFITLIKRLVNKFNESFAVQYATHLKNPEDVGLWLFYVLIKAKKAID